MSTNFIEEMKVVPTEQEEKRKREIEAYKSFLSETLPGYIGLMEAINHTITELEIDGIVGKTKLRARLKSVNSALKNTDEKVLDDIFGFEIITPTERDKEIIMLIIHNLFVGKYVRQKNHNKSNGYFAHHCTGTVKTKLDGTEASGLEGHILASETYELKEQYRDMPKKEQKKYRKDEIYCKKPRYPILKQEILKNGKIDEKLQQEFEWALDFIDQYLSEDLNLRRNMPIVEVQFKTSAVEQETKCGRAQHVKYKKVNEEEIRQKYFERKLVRGVDFPFTFIRNNDGELEIEHTNKTLVSMWPFLEDAIEKYKESHSCPVANYDMYFARIFPDLEPYIKRNLAKEPSLPVDNCDAAMAWSILKNKIINKSFVLPNSKGIEKVVGEK